MNLGDVLGFSKQNIGDIGGLNSFIGGIASQGVQYAMGGDFTMNVLNLSMFGIEDRNENAINQGLFEIGFGRDGFSAGVGMGGMDASYGAIASVINGAAAWGTNTKIQNYIKNGGLNAAIALRAQYGYGDKTQRDQLFDILNGGTSLVLGSEGEYGAQTITGSDGRTVYLEGYREGMSAGEQFALAVLLGHEAHRDGVNNGIMGQMLETQGAARGHTEMLVRMLNEGQGVAMNDNLMADLQAYFQGDNAFNSYVNANYDSSADYWRLIAQTDEEGNINGYSVEWDDDLNMTIVNADGTEITLDYNNIRTDEGMEAMSQWFGDNGLTFDDALQSGFIALGTTSEVAQALVNAIDSSNSAGNFGNLANSFIDSITALSNSGLQISNLGAFPEDQSAMYSLMPVSSPNSLRRTSLFGYRLVTAELNGAISGDLHHWGTYYHDGEDYAGGSEIKTPTTTNSVDLRWSNSKGFGIDIGFENGYSFINNHLSSASVMNLLQSMLLSGQNGQIGQIAAGLQFATVGNTGSATTGAHNHLEGYGPNGLMRPSEIFATMGIPMNYTDDGIGLSGYSDMLDFNDEILLRDIFHSLGEAERRAYVNTHSELFQPRIESYPRRDNFGREYMISITYYFDPIFMDYRTFLSR